MMKFLFLELNIQIKNKPASFCFGLGDWQAEYWNPYSTPQSHYKLEIAYVEWKGRITEKFKLQWIHIYMNFDIFSTIVFC